MKAELRRRAAMTWQKSVIRAAGCAAGLVLARLGAHVTATDLPRNLPLLRRNVEACGAYIRQLLVP